MNREPRISRYLLADRLRIDCLCVSFPGIGSMETYKRLILSGINIPLFFMGIINLPLRWLYLKI